MSLPYSNRKRRDVAIMLLGSGKRLRHRKKIRDQLAKLGFKKVIIMEEHKEPINKKTEYGALLGMEKLLKKGCVLMMEFNTPSIREYGKEPKEVFDYIIDLGYDISFPDRPLTWNELNELGTKWGGINIVCTPNQ